MADDDSTPRITPVAAKKLAKLRGDFLRLPDQAEFISLVRDRRERRARVIKEPKVKAVKPPKPPKPPKEPKARKPRKRKNVDAEKDQKDIAFIETGTRDHGDAGLEAGTQKEESKSAESTKGVETTT